jgi:single-strand DNA-binding protein
MNHVNLIGKISSLPQVVETENGRKIAKFTLSTREIFLDADGKTKSRKNKHFLTAWGRWVQVLEELADIGTELAIEGRLISRFYSSNGQRKHISEVEINDLIIL